MLRCDHATPLLLLYHAMPHCFRVGVSILSPLSAYSPPPHSACLHLQVAMATGCLASQSLNAQAQRQAILADGFDQPSRLHCWIYQGFVSSLLCGFFLRKNESDWHFGHAQKWAATLKSLINVPLGLSWWASDTCSVIFAAVLCSRAQSLCWAISALPNVIRNQCLFLN